MQPSYSTALGGEQHGTGQHSVAREDLTARLGATCTLLHGALSPAEAKAVIQTAEARGYGSAAPGYPPSYRTNDRLVVDDPALAARLLSRMRPHVPERLRDERGGLWRLHGLNPRFRLCRYRPGQHFGLHRDGVFHDSDSRRSRLTFMVYLNDHGELGHGAFTGGRTRFFAGRDRAAPMLAAVLPRCGSLIVFDHSLWHDGEPVTAGVKYILRSDIMYERTGNYLSVHGPGDADNESCAGATDARMIECIRAHRGYVWRVMQLDDGRLATSSRDPDVRLWRRRPGTQSRSEAHALDGELRGHTASITALCQPAPGTLWTGARDGEIRCWDVAARVEVARMAAHRGAVLCMVALPRGRVASSSADGTIKMWTASGRCLATLRGHESWVWSLARLCDGRLVSASEDGSARLWSTERWQPGEDQRPLATLVDAGAHNPLTAACALPRDRMAVAGGDGILRVLDRGGEIHEIAAHQGKITHLACLPGDLLASAGEDDRARLWCTSNVQGTILQPVAALEHDDFVTSVAALADGSLATSSYDGTVRRWRRPRNPRSARRANRPSSTTMPSRP